MHQQTHLRRTKMSWTQGIQGLNENKKVGKDREDKFTVAEPEP